MIMNLENQAHSNQARRYSSADSASVLADIYQDDVNMSIWRRALPSETEKAAQAVLKQNPSLQISLSTSLESVYEGVYQAIETPGRDKQNAQVIAEDIAEIVSMFCYLFDLKRVGLRLAVLDRAMCPKFHVDRVPCRLITTYSGIATEWLEHDSVCRDKLGLGKLDKTDKEVGLYRADDQIKQLQSGDVALLKGESWLGNEGAGLVHRSPSLNKQNKRLLLTLDFN